MINNWLQERTPRIAGRLAIAIAAAATLGACAQFGDAATKFSPDDFGVAASEQVINRGRVPSGGGYEHTGNPYVVAGKVYVPQSDPDYSEVGYASWYGPNFHGRRTANGEIYNMDGLSAAHTTLPLPSYVRVTNLGNGASVVVRVNDRGPFHSDRIIDLSAQAAELLGMVQAGVAWVQVDYIGRASLEGDDNRMLMATYQAPGTRAGPVVAYDPSSRTVSTSGARRGLFSQFGNNVAAAVFQPAALAEDQDPLADLLGDARAYAPMPALSSAQIAAEKAAAGVLDPNETVMVQVGVFAERFNANRIAMVLTEFGTVTVTELDGAGGPMWSVRVATLPGDRRATINAAAEAGANGAYAIN